MARFIPNLLTLLNLLSGCLALVFVFESKPLGAIMCIGFSLLFDLFDGMSARMLNQQNPIGKELDSLADLVSFGVVPGAMYYQLLKGLEVSESITTLPFLGFIFALFGAYRLARFNIHQSEQEHFTGLPIPSAAMFVVGLYWIAYGEGCASCASAFINPYVLFLSLIFLSYLMISDLPHFSFKMKSLRWSDNQIQWTFVVLLIPVIALMREASLSIAIVLYIFLSLAYYTFLAKTV